MDQIWLGAFQLNCQWFYLLWVVVQGNFLRFKKEQFSALVCVALEDVSPVLIPEPFSTVAVI
jgi:hypothetical protein